MLSYNNTHVFNKLYFDSTFHPKIQMVKHKNKNHNMFSPLLNPTSL
jgi:hypothetical protein